MIRGTRVLRIPEYSLLLFQAGPDPEIVVEQGKGGDGRILHAFQLNSILPGSGHASDNQ